MFSFDNVVVAKSKRRSIAIVILSCGIVEVRAPKYIPEFAIKAFVKSKTNCIEKRLEVVTKLKAETKRYVDGEKFLYLGNEYELLLGPYVSIEASGNKLHFPLAMASRGKFLLEKWYIKQAKLVIKNLVEEYSEWLDLPFEAISFSDTKSKWGSCSHDNRLQFNWRLIMAPLLVIRYVVIHELVHTLHKDHHVIFWNKVRKINPSYKQQIKWLKLNGGKLQNV